MNLLAPDLDYNIRQSRKSTELYEKATDPLSSPR